MKKVVFVAFFLVLLTSGSLPAHAVDYGKGPFRKLVRGVVNVVTSPFQLPKEIIETTQQAEPTAMAPYLGAAAGPFNGVYHVGRQFLSGVLDIVTFASPLDRDWGPPMRPNPLTPEV